MTYQEKLQDPRWLEFRDEVLEHWNYRCRKCRRDGSEVYLHVHHPFYRRNSEPWDYDVWEVQCLCEDCHRKAHGIASDDDVPF
jgi:5-methylcytosine-specific restriction endonuclease McrA